MGRFLAGLLVFPALTMGIAGASVSGDEWNAPALSTQAPEPAAQFPRSLSDSAFAALVERLSEPSGYFDTDNLISNEDSYLHPISTLNKLGVSGGVYVGVGPDQNFSYIAAVRPHVAFIVDIRRDNLLEHLLFKAIFALSRNRADYVALLFGRSPPADTTGWGAKPVDSLLFHVAGGRADSAATTRIRSRVLVRIQQTGVKLSATDLQTIQRFHATFIAAGPSLRFNSFGRAPQPYYPDFRRLARELDRNGRQASFLAHEADFRIVKELEDRNLIVPVVGDFAGTRALAGIAEWMIASHDRLSAFYTSNVEQYLFRDGGFDTFAKTIGRFPVDAKSVFIRSCFICAGHPQAVTGYHAVQLVQPLSRFTELRAAGQLDSYRTLVTAGLVEP
jgi:hypothetical protein